MLSPVLLFPCSSSHVYGSGRKPKLTPRGGAGEFGEVDWQLLYNESDGLVLTDLMAFSISNGADSAKSALLLCKLLHIPKAFTAQVLRATASAHGLNSLDICRQLLCSAFQKVLEREALLQHIHVKQGLGVFLCPAPHVSPVLPAASVLMPAQVRPRTRTSCAWVASQRRWR
jgi:hypothetical protein